MICKALISAIFARLAAEVSTEAGAQAVETEKHMGRLREIIREVRSVPCGIGYNWQDFPRRDYDTATRFAYGALHELVVERVGAST